MNIGERDGATTSAPRLVPATGSLVGGVPREKTARITDAMADLQLGIDGLRAQSDAAADGNRWANSLGAFARTSSVFLRKTVLGDEGKRETRLLDDRVLEAIGLKFNQLRKIPKASRRELEVGFCLTSATLQITKLDDLTLQPEAAYHFHAGPQELQLSIEWPLPGVAGWTGVPSETTPWQVSANELFQVNSESRLSCDEWLAQQVVLFDGKGISLRDIIRAVANFEGAHAIDVSSLTTPVGQKASRAARNPAPHILNAVTMCGIRYLHLVVIETALYIYQKLLGVDSIKRPTGEIYMIKLGVACSPDQADSLHPDWVTFQGGMTVSFSETPTVIRHKIKAVG